MDLLLIPLSQTLDYESPFRPETPGFTEQWWFGRTGRVQRRFDDFYTFELEGEEVARAEVDPNAEIADIYLGLVPPPTVVDISFFEVRAGHRLQGVGCAALALLKDRYPRRVMTAFSEDADGFWVSAGWRRHERRDRATNYRPLFVTESPA